MSADRIHTSIAGAHAIKPLGSVVIAQKWKQTSNQQSKERAIIIPMECMKAPEVPESFRALVESALLSSAEAVLKAHCNEEPHAMEVNAAEMFSRVALTEAFLQRGDSWLTKQELEIGFTASSTWKRITSREEFKTNSAYQAAANSFKETILKLTGKNVQIDSDRCDTILAKLEDSDLETDFGQFVVRRLTSLKARVSQDVDFSSL